MTRQEEFDVIKNLIKENFKYGECGLFDTRNIVGDSMNSLFKGEHLALDICYDYSYFEVFELSHEEFMELSEYYYNLRIDD